MHYDSAVTPDDAHDVILFLLEVGVLAAQHLGLPEPVQVVAQRSCAHEPQAVLLADVFKLDGGHLVE